MSQVESCANYRRDGSGCEGKSRWCESFVIRVKRPYPEGVTKFVEAVEEIQCRSFPQLRFETSEVAPRLLKYFEAKVSRS